MITSGKLFAGTSYFGLWCRPLSEMTGTATVSPRRNPQDPRGHRETGTVRYNGSGLAVEFTLLHPGRATIVVHDLTGRVVASIVNRKLEAGTYRYCLNGGTFPRGCYAVSIQTDGNAFTKLIRTVY
jgi:hypothetical protein